METTDIPIRGMTCDGCVKSVTRVLSALPGVARAEVSLQPPRARVTYDASKTDVGALKQAVEGAGFEAG